MNGPLYIAAKGLISLIQALPLTTVARLGRAGGALAYYLDGRHRKVARRNLSFCFPEKTPEEIRALARENFRRIGENFSCAVKTAAMSLEELRPHLELGGEPMPLPEGGKGAGSIVFAIGHFGNFELYARVAQLVPGYKAATTYRGLRQASFNSLLQKLREKSQCSFFERRFDAGPLKAFMNEPPVMLGLLADQHAGTHGLRLPFLGRDCATSAAPAVFALRYRCSLRTGICYRVGLARWRVEVGAEIPVAIDGQPRSTSDIMLDVNRAFETAVRRDPANWFWVHNRWKSPGGQPRADAGTRVAESPKNPPRTADTQPGTRRE